MGFFLCVCVCWVLSHYLISLNDGEDTKYSILEVGMVKFDLEFDRTSLKCMRVIRLGI